MSVNQKQNNILVCHLSVHSVHKWLKPFVNKNKANVYYVNPFPNENEKKKLTPNDIILAYEDKKVVNVFDKLELTDKIDNILTVYCRFDNFIYPDKKIVGKWIIDKEFMDNTYKLLKRGGKLYFQSLHIFYNYLFKPHNIYAISAKERKRKFKKISDSELNNNDIFKFNNSKDYYKQDLPDDMLKDVYIQRFNFLTYYHADPSYDKFNLELITSKLFEPYLSKFKIIQYPIFNASMSENNTKMDNMLILEKR